ncbi:hypothetical protein P8452_59965 [Trifolium repens]|nr:hypothetical protein P8452_59965 [Trifolium repens]
MLLKPRNSMEGYCQKLKLNINDTLFSYYISGTTKCSNCVSIFPNQKCLCGELMNVGPVFPSDLISIDNGFVKEMATFIIQDDLSVMPNDLVKSLGLLRMNGINDIADIERKTLLISKMEAVDLLKLSILSETPLTDFIFRKDSNPTFLSENRIGQSLPSEEAEEDFADFLFSFLTFPMGGVLQMLEGFSSLSCIDSLYKSMTELSPERYLRSLELQNLLSKPPIFPKFEVKNQILPIKTTTFTRKSRSVPLEFVDPKYSLSGGFTRGPLTFMVTDNLVVTPMSSFDGVSYLERMQVPLNDVEEIVINIGVKEGLSILKASLTSTSALIDGLKQHLDICTTQPGTDLCCG